ncbi:LPXTG cell wall anchor domain-containing protein [Arthrobacter sp. GMC3]|uniref:LPXTG cell wall anchor domain-containing protein n=1 Tax=Arthrobacter sp. GMC3 TaxID=2058894 RepID=UPI000CE40127|nr:LPXTG cell wall anchor domain-containing protein [Arthrobacter sp. GMC3]
MRGNTGRTTGPAARFGRRRGILHVAAAIGLTAGMALATGAGAMADSASGPGGQTLTADRSAGLNAAGDSVSVSGAGFDLSKGVYLGVCVNNGPGAAATPCLGGVDTTGGSGSSVWISSNPPSYGQGLAQPFIETGGKGSFTVNLSVQASDALTNCEDKAKAPNGCVIVTRADHTRSADRSADVMIPISFGAAAQPAAGSQGAGALAKTGATTGIVVAGGAVLLAAGAGAVVMTRRRKGGN